MKALIKKCVYFTSVVIVLPVLLSYFVLRVIFGQSQAIESTSQFLCTVPGLTGVYLRAAYYSIVFEKCARNIHVGYGTLFSQSACLIEDNVYIGPRCQLGMVHLGRDVLLAAGVHIPSGGQTHFFADPSVPIREQGGERKLVRIGAGAWIGSAAIILADVGDGTVVGAGSVVTKPLPANVVAVGVPARVVRRRFPNEANPSE